MGAITSFFSTSGFLPHGYCLLWRPDILALHAISDLTIAAAYFSIPLAIFAFVRRRRDLIGEHRLIAILFSIFILGCGLTHVLGVVVLWRPVYALDGLVKAFTAVVSIITAILLWPFIPRLLAIPSPGQLAAANTNLRAEVAAKNRALDELSAIRAGLEAEVRRRLGQSKALLHRLEIATDGSLVTVCEQDQALRYTWLHNPRPPMSEAWLGRTDSEAFDPAAAAMLEPLKRHVLASGEKLRTEIALAVGEVRHHFAMTLTRIAQDGAAPGLLIASVDITEQKRQQERQQVIARELAHRAKNVLALVEGIARQSVKAENLPEAVVLRFTSRLAALGRAHDLLVGADWAGIDLAALVTSQLKPVLPDASDGVVLDGPPGIMVSAEIGQYLALALHELATNALKYGVLARSGGQLAVRWSASDETPQGRRIVIDWSETGAPFDPPTRHGFGRLLLESIVPRALQGEAALDFNASGMTWRAAFNQEVAQPAIE